MMIDPSAPEPIVKWSEAWWAQARPETRARRCTAHRKNGDRCKRLALNFQRVCSHHGGRARQSVEAAKRRMMENADPAVKKLTEIAYDPNQSADIRLKATLAIIDRAGLSPRGAIEIEVTARPYETVFEVMESGSREAYRGGLTELTPALVDNPKALDASDNEPIDVQTVDFEESNAGGLLDCGQPITPGGAENLSPFDTAPATDGLMSLEDATSAAAQIRRNAASHRAQRPTPRDLT